MTERYIQLVQDLQYTKRELNIWRQKHSQSQVELQTTREEISQLKKSIQRLTQSNNKLSNENKHLNDEKQSILTDYTNQVNQIKQEISFKQKEITQLRQKVTPSKVDQHLALRHMKYELSEQFQGRMAAKQRRIEELSSFIQKMKYQREIQQQKSRLTISSLEANLNQLKNNHDQQIRQYSHKIYTLQHPKVGTDKQHLKRLKRQNQELHIQIQLLNKELNSILQQKNKQIQDYNQYMNDYKKDVLNHHKEIEVYKQEIQRLRIKQDREMEDKNEHLVRDRDREIKRLKTQIQLARDESLDKDRRISDLEVERNRLNNEIKVIRSQKHKYEEVHEDSMNQNRDRIMQELKMAYTTIEKLRQQNFELNQKLHELATSNQRFMKKKNDDDHNFQTNHKGSIEVSKERKQHDSPIKLVTTEIRQRHNSSSQNVHHYHHQSKEKYNINGEKQRQYEDAIAREQGKLKEFLTKYIELKKKNENLQKKLKKANEKIVQLLKNKIVLGSPKAATSKHFQFPTGYENSPPKQHQNNSKQRQSRHHMIVDDQGHVNYSPNFKHQPSIAQIIMSNHQINTSQAGIPHPHPHAPRTSKNMNNQYSRTNPNMIRNFHSPQDHKMLIEDNENDQSYYQRSTKIKKSTKLIDMKCLNHEHYQNEEQNLHHCPA